MTFTHGSYAKEVPTALNPPASAVTATAGLQVVIGTAPINLANSTEYVNKPLLAYTRNDVVSGIGYSENWEDYTLSESVFSNFDLYNIAPVVFINVLDPTIHKTSATKIVSLINKKAVVEVEGILLNTLTVKLSESEEVLVKNKDYTATFDSKGHVVITILDEDFSRENIYATYDKLDPSLVDEDDIIGSLNVDTGAATGLELINSIFPKFGLVPGQILIPKFSKNPIVAAVMRAKANNINGFFKATSITDVDIDAANTYAKAPEWKKTNGYTAPHEFVCWPKVQKGEKIFNASTHLASRIALTDSENANIPYVSPSNKDLKMTGLVNDEGQEIVLGPEQATYLNSQGIVTALNWAGSWKVWGNRTAAYFSTAQSSSSTGQNNTDVKDVFIPNKRMNFWIANSIILTTWKKVDDAANKRLIRTVVDNLNIWLNGLTATGALLGGRVEFRQEDNPLADLLDGKIRYRVFIAAPTPAETIEFTIEVDVNYYNSIFSA